MDCEDTATDIEDQDSDPPVARKKLKPQFLRRSNAIQQATPLLKPLPSPPECRLNADPKGDGRKDPANLFIIDPTPSSTGFGQAEGSSSSSQTADSCHCSHQHYWTKEILTILMRIEKFLNRSGILPNNTQLEDEVDESIIFPKTANEILLFFQYMKENDEMRKKIIQQVSREVSKKLEKSVEKVILRIAPPAAWSDFSKNGQRGKHSAVEMGLHTFVVDCLKFSKVRNDTHDLSLTYMYIKFLKFMNFSILCVLYYERIYLDTRIGLVIKCIVLCNTVSLNVKYLFLG